ncbi:MAG: HEAT repeat domain-containing protein [Gaiellaceae bacterium]
MTAAGGDIGARVDALAHAHQGDEFVAAVGRLAAELGPDAQPALQQALLERAAEEADFQRAVRRRFAEKGWMRRTLARLERAWGADRAEDIVVALEAGAEGDQALAAETERLRRERGKAALVLDELSRNKSARVRAWVPGAAADALGAGGVRLMLSLARDRDPAVREAALTALLSVDREAARALGPDLRRRLHSGDEGERVAAIWALAELGDERSLDALRERAESAAGFEERAAARAATLVLTGDESAIVAGLRAGEAEDGVAVAAAARILGSEPALAALRECAESAGDERLRTACGAELKKAGGSG